MSNYLSTALLAGRALAIMVRIDILLKLGKYGHLRRSLMASRPSMKKATRHNVDEIVFAVSLASELYSGSSPCLVRAVALAMLNHRNGLPAEVIIGVRACPVPRPCSATVPRTDFEGHAWVESEALAIDEDPDSIRQYVVVDRF